MVLNRGSILVNLLLNSLLLFPFINVVPAGAERAGGRRLAGENPLTAKAALIRYWENKISNNLPKPQFLLDKASPLNALDLTTFSKLAEQKSLPAHLDEFCSKANLLCGQDLVTTLRKQYNTTQREIVNYTVAPGMYFREHMLKPGTLMPMPDIRDKLPKRSFLPRVIASKLPFSSAHLPDQFKEIFQAGYDEKSGNLAGYEEEHSSYPMAHGEKSRILESRRPNSGYMNGYGEKAGYVAGEKSGYMNGYGEKAGYMAGANEKGGYMNGYGEKASYMAGANEKLGYMNGYGEKASHVIRDEKEIGYANGYGEKASYLVGDEEKLGYANGYGVKASYVVGDEKKLGYANGYGVKASYVVGDEKKLGYANGYGVKASYLVGDEKKLGYANGYGVKASYVVGDKEKLGYANGYGVKASYLAGDEEKLGYANGYGVKASYVVGDEEKLGYANGYGVKASYLAGDDEKLGYANGYGVKASYVVGDEEKLGYANGYGVKASYLAGDEEKLGYANGYGEKASYLVGDEKLGYMNHVKRPGRHHLTGVIGSKIALHDCPMAASPGEMKRCVGSEEDMIDFAASVLGQNIEARATENTRGIKGDILIGSVKGINGENITKTVICHQTLHPYLMYNCHSVPLVRMYEVDILDPTTKFKINHGVALCHLDTSSWTHHEAFLALGSSPGKIEVCHWVFENDVAWVIAE